MKRYIHAAGVPVFAALMTAPRAAAAPLTAGRILVTTDESSTPANSLYEYTTAGVKTQTFSVPYPSTPRDNPPRDIAVTPTGQV